MRKFTFAMTTVTGIGGNTGGRVSLLSLHTGNKSYMLEIARSVPFCTIMPIIEERCTWGRPQS
jgi:hypothetical protein